MTSLITIISLALTRMHSSEDQVPQNTPPQHAPTACAQQQRTSVRPSGPKDPCKTGKSAAPSSGTEPPARRKRQRRSRSKKSNKSPSVALTYPQLPAVYELRRKQCPSRRLRRNNEGAYLSVGGAIFSSLDTVTRGWISKRVPGFMSVKTFEEVFDLFEDDGDGAGTKRFHFREEDD